MMAVEESPINKTLAKAVEAWFSSGKDVRKAAKNSGLSMSTIRRAITKYNSKYRNGETLKSKV